MKVFIQFGLFLLYILATATCHKFRTVSTNCGLVRGQQETSMLKKVSFYSFRGIPYAQPPIEELRFKAPAPVKPWHPETLNATAYGSICVQNGFILNDTSPQSEDCLFFEISSFRVRMVPA